MRRLKICILFILCFFLGSSVTQAQGDPVNEIIQRVNALRASYGVPAYLVDYALMYAAQTQASWSAENDHIGHDGPGGSSPNDRSQAAGYGGGENSYAIENAAHGTASLNTPELVVTMWQSDWGHLNAMISADYEHIGVGYAEANGYSWYVMMVGWVGAKASSGETQVQEVPVGETSSVPFVLSEPDEFGAIYHEVQPEQAAWTIAVKYGIELADLFELNNLTEDSILHPGDVLMIQPPDPPTSTPTSQRSTDISPEIPSNTPTPPQATEVSVESNVRPSQTASAFPNPNEENVPRTSSRSNVYTISLIIGLGMVLLISVIIVSRLRKK